MEPIFRIGDKIRIRETAKSHPWFHSNGMSSFIGSIHTVKNVEKCSSPYALDDHYYELDDTSYRWDASMLGLVESAEEKEPESEYNIGDIVEILPRIYDAVDYTNAYTDWMCSYAGKIYTITDKYKRDYKASKIKDDGFVYKLAETGGWNWCSSMFKKAEQEKFSKTKKPTEKLEPAVGEVFDYEGKSYVCIEANMIPDEACKNCSFREVHCGFITCTRKRKDHKEVYFQEILNIPFEKKYDASSVLVSSAAYATSPALMSSAKLIASTPLFADTSTSTAESKKDSNKSIIEYIMDLNKKPNYKLKFKL